MDRVVLGRVSLTLAAALVGVVACKSQADLAPSPGPGVAAASASSPASPGKVRVVESREGAVESVVRDAIAGARAEGRTLVVYVGATWCEPCQKFHHAAERGELDAAFPRLTLLEFDLDRDRERLAAAGYASKYIPLFALPGPDGAASGKQIEGGIKGDGAVGYISTRLEQMLSE
jgi:thiol-disulfide isomerase/thioredoxin